MLDGRRPDRRRRRLRDQAHDPHGARDRRGGPLPDRRQHAAPRRERAPAGAQRHRPGQAPHDGPDHLRRVPPQPDHRELHPDRRGHQRHRRRRHDHRGAHRAARVAARRRGLGSQPAGARRPVGAARTARRHRVADRPPGLRQVDDRRGAGGADRAGRLPGVPARRRQPPVRAQQRSRLRARRPGREHPPGGARRQPVRRLGRRSRSSA